MHFAVANIGVFEDCFQVFHVSTSFFSATHVRFGNDFDKSYACAVVVNCGEVRSADGCTAVNQFTSVLFHMDTGNANAFFFAIYVDVDVTIQADRFIQLGDLVVGAKVRIEIAFAVEFVVFLDFAVYCQTSTNCKFYNLFVQNRESTGQAQAAGANMGVRYVGEFCGAGAECFRFSFQLSMNFQADNGSIFSHYLLPPNGAITLWKSVACSKV